MQPEQPIQPTYTPPPVPQQAQGGFTPKQKKLMIIAGILLALFILVMIGGAIFGGQTGPTESTLTSVNARNSGILNLIESYEEELVTEEGKAYATQAKILVMSDNNQLVSYTTNRYGSTFSASQFENTGISQTSNALADRVGQPNFDQDFISTIQFEANLNKSLLEQLSQTISDEQLRSIAETAINNYQALL